MVALKQEQEHSTTLMSDEEIMADLRMLKGWDYGPKPPRSQKEMYSQDYVQSLEARLAQTQELVETERRENERNRVIVEEALQSQRLQFKMQREEYERRFSQMNELLERFTGGSSSLSKVILLVST